MYLYVVCNLSNDIIDESNYIITKQKKIAIIIIYTPSQTATTKTIITSFVNNLIDFPLNFVIMFVSVKLYKLNVLLLSSFDIISFEKQQQ